MGWTGMRKPRDVAAWMKKTLTWDADTKTNSCLDVALVDRGREGYAAVESIDKATGLRTVWAAVFLLRYHPRSQTWETFLYKDMSEHSGPSIENCPARILDQLTATDSPTAEAWRAACRARHARRAQARGIKPGTTIRFRAPIGFKNGTEADQFAFLRGSTFYVLTPAGLPGELVRIGAWRERDDWQVTGQITLSESARNVRLSPRRIRWRKPQGETP